MLNSYFLNACIMLALVAASYHMYNIYEDKLVKRPILSKVIIGLTGGLISVTLMLNAIRVDATTIIDFRNILVILCAVFGGPLSALITATIITIARIGLNGITHSTIIAGVSIFTIGISASLVSRLINNFTKVWIACFGINILVSTSSLCILLHKSPDLFKILSYYIIGSSIMTLFLYGVVKFYLTFHNKFRKLTAESTKDYLTGINNVRAFDIEFNKAIQQSARKNEHLTFLTLDIDFFKKVNDIYGHATGDLVLKQLSNLLLETCRVFDIVSRNGGEEFSVILQDCPSSHAFEVAERIRVAVEHHNFEITHKRSINITVSIGLATYPDTTENAEALIEFADKALYKAKHSGRNKVVLYDNYEND